MAVSALLKASVVLGEVRHRDQALATLDFLMEAGLVHRLDSLNDYIGCPDPAHAHSGQFLICRSCQDVIELDEGAINERIVAAAAAAGFEAERQMLEVRGVCSRCADKSPD